MHLTRRSFLGALAAVVAAPRMLANLRTSPLRYEEMPLGLIDVCESSSLHGLTESVYPLYSAGVGGDGEFLIQTPLAPGQLFYVDRGSLARFNLYDA